MSTLRNARLTRTKISSNSRWSSSHLLRLAMSPPHLLGGRLDLDGVLQDRVAAMPLDEVCPAHERPMLGRAAVVVPQVEVGKVERCLERFAQKPLLAQSLHDVLDFLDLLIGTRDDALGIGVHAVDEWLRVAIPADVLHGCLSTGVLRPLVGHLREE